ncbi:MAG: nuclear transport factor 2 family protein [Bacteroidales bacterium]|nr:nuclear transport factor 2 family protein [Bacteroidales bacterium]
MKKCIHLIFTCTSLLLFIALHSCTTEKQKIINEAEIQTIATVIDNSISWFKTKDFDLLFATMADDTAFFMFQPTSDATVRGIEQFRGYSDGWIDSANHYVSHEIRDLNISIGPAGDVAWFRAELDDCGEYSGQVGCWKDTRWTGVLEKRKGKWVIVQQHFSFAADRVADRVKKRLMSDLSE